MPPLAISKADLARLVEITAESIRMACFESVGREPGAAAPPAAAPAALQQAA